VIQTVTMYKVICDRCGVDAEDGTDYYAWSFPDVAEEMAAAADWLIVAKDSSECFHYCPGCIEWNEDEQVPKAPLEPVPAKPVQGL